MRDASFSRRLATGCLRLGGLAEAAESRLTCSPGGRTPVEGQRSRQQNDVFGMRSGCDGVAGPVRVAEWYRCARQTGLWDTEAAKRHEQEWQITIGVISGSSVLDVRVHLPLAVSWGNKTCVRRQSFSRSLQCQPPTNHQNYVAPQISWQRWLRKNF